MHLLLNPLTLVTVEFFKLFVLKSSLSCSSDGAIYTMSSNREKNELPSKLCQSVGLQLIGYEGKQENFKVDLSIAISIVRARLALDIQHDYWLLTDPSKKLTKIRVFCLFFTMYTFSRFH